MNSKLAGMAGTALAVLALTGVSMAAAPSRFTGSISLAAGQTWEDDDTGFSNPIFDDSFTSISGEAKVNIAFSGTLNLQLGFVGNGSFIDSSSNDLRLDRDASFQGDAHLYWRTDRYAIGPFVGGGVASGPNFFDNNGARNAEYYFVGLEGQYYWDTVTVGVKGGYLDSSSEDTAYFNGPKPTVRGDDLFLSNAWFVEGEIRWYCSPKFAFTAEVGYISGDARFGYAEVDTVTWGAKAEYWPEEKEGLSLWVAYEGRSSDFDYNNAAYFANDFEKDNHTVKIGATFHFGVDEGNSRAQDRDGPAWNQDDYGAVVVGG